MLETIAFALIINNHSFHRSKFISTTNSISGSIIKKINTLNSYISLKKENEKLFNENVKLKNILEKEKISYDTIKEVLVLDTIKYNQQYKYIGAQIIQNSYNNPYNFITINRGKTDGVDSEMAVINDIGIIGVTENTTQNYARVQSILNKNSKINARFKKGYHFGTLTWDGINHSMVQLKDIPRQAIYKIGDTIITGGKSTIFPEGIDIGIVASVAENKTTKNTINIKLFNDMSNLKNVYIIKNFDKKEIELLNNNK